MDNQSSRVNLDRMRRAYDSTRDSARNVSVLTQRAVAHINKDMHMVGRVGRFRLEFRRAARSRRRRLGPGPSAKRPRRGGLLTAHSGGEVFAALRRPD